MRDTRGPRLTRAGWLHGCIFEYTLNMEIWISPWAHHIFFFAKRLLLPAMCGLFAISLCGCGFFGGKIDTGPAPLKARKVVSAAASQMGKKYIAGGASPKNGFDCSGLIWWAYRQNGMKVPRITVEQAKTGQSVPKRLARAGDIMVFRTGNSPRGLHTGLYAGRGRFIHSPRKGKTVRLENLEPFWNRRLVAVRRVVEK